MFFIEFLVAFQASHFRGDPFDQVVVNLLEDGDLVVSDHFIGSAEQFRVVGVGQQCSSEGLEHKHPTENVRVLPYISRDNLNWDLCTHIDEALLDNFSQLSEEGVTFAHFCVNVLDVVADVLSDFAFFFERIDDALEDLHPSIVFVDD